MPITAISSQQVSSWSIAAMSAIEQPAARSGRITFLVRQRQHVGALGHEVHAAEHDELGLGVLRHFAGEAERVADVVGELDHLVALIVMTEHDQPAAERRLRGGDAAIELLVGQAEITLGQRLALGELRLLELRQDRNVIARHL